MAGALRIGVLGLTHDHVWSNTRELVAAGGQLIGVADPHSALVEQATREFGCTGYLDYATLLEEQQLDAVYIFGDNAGGVEAAEMAAARHLHMMVEKPMAATLEGADRMLAAARRNGVRLMVNWPFAWWPQLQHAIALARQGEIGELWQVKYRSAHEGPRELGCSEYFCEWLYDRERNGAGAYMDYCCYGTALARLLLGVPSRVVGVSGRLVKEDIVVDDNGIVVMSYPHAMAIAEGSWTQIGHLTAYVATFYGTRGILYIEPGRAGRLLLATAEQPEGIAVSVPEPTPAMRTASANFLHGVTSGEPFFPLCQDRVARDAQEILEAGLLSAESGSEVSLPLPNA
jgi:predicted dehydrogenase